MPSPLVGPIVECPRCGRCDEAGVATCPADGSTMGTVPWVPRVIDGKYRIEQLLGRGGMGAVYRARDIRQGLPIAVKVVRAELLGDPEARLRFRNGAQVVARLRHPSIVAILDYGTLDEGGAYLVMELVTGEDLRHVLLREGRVEPARAAAIMTSLCAAIEAAHREGVLHGDLKPENILLTEDTATKVLDFGVATAIDERRHVAGAQAEPGRRLTGDALIVGTPAYMAPEQLRGGVPDARADVFSLGVIAYEMLSGGLPFGRGSLTEVVLAQARGVPPLRAAGVPPGVARAVRAALDLDVDRRPPSSQAFAHLIRAGMGM